MAEISTNSGKINVSAGQNTVDVGITRDYSQYYSNLSKDWATKTNGLVNNEDYSSKYYAEKSKDWATNSENNLNSVISQHEQITSEITQAREDISTDLSGALLDIESNKTNSITEIKTEGAEQVDTIKKTGFYVQDGDLYCLDAEGKPKKLDTISDYSINNVHSFGDSKYVSTPVNNLSWLKSEGQQNAEAVYPDVYNWILENVNSGVEGFKRSTETYTDYDYVINTADETFRLPLLNGSENLPSNTVLKTIDNTAINTTETLTLFTASHNGFVNIRVFGLGEGRGRTGFVFKNGIIIGCIGVNDNSYNQGTVSFEVKRGDVITISADITPLTYNYNYFKAVGNGSLYYYVGETVQNENLINAGRLGEELVNIKTSIDGEWVYSNHDLVSNITIPANNSSPGSVNSFDLSNILPNDGYSYEVILDFVNYTGNKNNEYIALYGTIFGNENYFFLARGVDNVGSQFIAIMPPSNRIFKIGIQSNSISYLYLNMTGYRQLGKKV